MAALGHDWDMDNWTTDGTSHWHACKNAGCTARKDEADHSGGTATCQTKAKCAVCEAEYGALADHDWGEWIPNGDVHGRVCKNSGLGCGADESEPHSGGEATCTQGKICDTCKAEYTDPLGHDLKKVDKLEPTCTAPGAEEYWVCQRDGCGKKFSDKDGKNEIEAPAVIPPGATFGRWTPPRAITAGPGPRTAPAPRRT